MSHWQPPEQPSPGSGLRLRWVLAAAAALAIAATTIGIVRNGGLSASVSPPKPSASAQAVTFAVGGAQADVTWGPAGSDLAGASPMRASLPLGSPSYYFINAQLNGSGSVTCAISIGGTVISQAVATGEARVAMCEAVPDGTGWWRDANSGA